MLDAVAVETTAVLIDRFGAFDLHAMALAILTLLSLSLFHLHVPLAFADTFYPLNPLACATASIG